MCARFALTDLPAKYAAQAQAQMYAKSEAPVSSPAPAAKSPRNAVSGAMAGLLPQVPGVKVKGPKVSESLMQQNVIKWFAVHASDWALEPELLLAIPLQANRTARNGARMKAEGARRGTPDLLLHVPRGDCCSLWIEMKSTRGVLSTHQKLMLKRLTAVGAATVVCRSAAEAQAAITAYLNLPRRTPPSS